MQYLTADKLCNQRGDDYTAVPGTHSTDFIKVLNGSQNISSSSTVAAGGTNHKHTPGIRVLQVTFGLPPVPVLLPVMQQQLGSAAETGRSRAGGSLSDS